MYDYVIIGAGIVGLATAYALTERHPEKSLLILEKEETVGFHQTGHNSGVIHSGIYYRPGSLKAQLTRKGQRQLIDFCHINAIPHAKNGKLIVAVKASELSRLTSLYQRGLENNLTLKWVSSKEISIIEPYLKALQGIWVSDTATVDYVTVTKKLAEIVESRGAVIQRSKTVQKIREYADAVILHTDDEIFHTRYLISCAGLQSDRLAHQMGLAYPIRIIPFRGEFYKIREEKAHYVKNLIYPVPNPDLPFLGIHFTRTPQGIVKIGPNALLTFKREGYGTDCFSWKDTLTQINFPGFWRLIGHYAKEGAQELWRAKIKSALIKTIQCYLPELNENDIEYYHCGIRAQAVDRNGRLIDDFLFEKSKRTLHVMNAPSPAATAAFPIGEMIVKQL